MVQRPPNVPSSIAIPSGAPGAQFTAAYLTQLGIALNAWIAQAANAINYLVSQVPPP